MVFSFPLGLTTLTERLLPLGAMLLRINQNLIVFAGCVREEEDRAAVDQMRALARAATNYQVMPPGATGGRSAGRGLAVCQAKS